MQEIRLTPLIDSLRLEKIDDSTYFSKKYENYISNSRLGLLKKEGPDSFFSGFKPIFSNALSLGSCVHQMCLQKESFTICESVDKPTAKLGMLADEVYYVTHGEIPTKEQISAAACKVDYFHGLLTQNQFDVVYAKCTPYWKGRRKFEDANKSDRDIIFLDAKTREIAKSCLFSLQENRQIQNILHPDDMFGSVTSENEQAILLDVLVEIPDLKVKFILKLKSKLDNYVIDTLSNEIQVNDVKTLGRILSEFQDNIEKFDYCRELAMYAFMLSLAVKKYYNMDDAVVKGNFLVVSTIPQYYTKVVPMTGKMFMQGFSEFKSLLKKVAYLVATDYKDFGIWN